MENDKKELWTLYYEHKFGSDISIYESAEEATLSAIDIILDWVHDEVREKGQQLEVLKHILEKQYDRAIEMYQEYSGREYITIERHTPHENGSFNEEELVEKAKAKFKKLKEEGDQDG